MGERHSRLARPPLDKYNAFMAMQNLTEGNPRGAALLSTEEYLELEQHATVKHEYVAGRLFALAGGTSRHNRLTLRIAVKLYQAAEERGCRLYTSDMKVCIRDSTSEVFYYPDVMLVCDPEGPPDPFYEEHPCVIAEVLSPSTEAVDRREKLLTYQRISSLQAYLLVSAEEARVEGYYREEGGWRYLLAEGQGEVRFPCVDVTLSLAEMYQGL